MVEQGAKLFDRLVIAVGVNPEKRYAFSLDERLSMLRESLSRLRNISVTSFSNHYLIDYAQSIGATHILRGIRSESDYEYERGMRNVNGDWAPAICTVFLMPPRHIAEVRSSMVKGLVGPKGWQRVVRPYVPPPVYRRFFNKRARTSRRSADGWNAGRTPAAEATLTNGMLDWPPLMPNRIGIITTDVILRNAFRNSTVRGRWSMTKLSWNSRCGFTTWSTIPRRLTTKSAALNWRLVVSRTAKFRVRLLTP